MIVDGIEYTTVDENFESECRRAYETLKSEDDINSIIDYVKVGKPKLNFKGGKVMVLLIGPPGAGKNYILENILPIHDYFLLDPDHVRKVFDSYRKKLEEDKIYTDLIEKCARFSSDLNFHFLESFLENNASLVIFNTPCGKTSKCKKSIQMAKNYGYSTMVITVNAKMKTAKRRILDRIIVEKTFITEQKFTEIFFSSVNVIKDIQKRAYFYEDGQPDGVVNFINNDFLLGYITKIPPKDVSDRLGLKLPGFKKPMMKWYKTNLGKIVSSRFETDEELYYLFNFLAFYYSFNPPDLEEVSMIIDSHISSTQKKLKIIGIMNKKKK